jgi:outer membrane protein assembly factor BamB
MSNRQIVNARVFGVALLATIGLVVYPPGAQASQPNAPTKSQSTIAVQPSNLSFGSQLVNTRSATRQVTVTALKNTQVASVQTGSANFVVTQNGCAGITLKANATCSITVAFAPAAAGSLTDTLSIADGKGSKPTTVALSGAGLASDWEQVQGGPQHSGQAPGGGPVSGVPNSVWSYFTGVPAPGRTAQFGAPLVAPNGDISVVRTTTSDPSCSIAVAAMSDAEIDTFSRTGQLLWTRIYNCDAIASIAISPTGLLVASDSSGLFALDAQGTAVWNRTFSAAGGGVTIGADGTIYTQANGTVNVYTASGTWLWTQTPPYAAGAGANSAPALSPDGSTLYLSGAGGIVTALSKTGTFIWQRTITDSGLAATLTGTPAIGADGSVHLATAGGTLTDLSSADGSMIWTYNNPTGGFATTPTVGANGDLVIGDLNGYLTALQEATGTFLWSYQDVVPSSLTPQPYTAPAVLDSAGNIFIQNAGFLGGYASNGSYIWETSGFAGSSPLAMDSSTGTMYLVRTSVQGAEVDAVH